MKIVEITERARWEALADTASAPLQQRWDYGAAMAALGAGVLRVKIAGGGARAAVQILHRRVCGLKVALASRGPLWIGGGDGAARTAVLRHLGKTLGARLLLTPESEDPALRRARFWPLLTPATMARLELGPRMRAAMHGKWRSRLVRGERAGLGVARLKPGRLDWLLDAELAQRRDRRYRALPADFVRAWGRDLLALSASRDGRPAAAMLFLRHGNTASYHIGWSGAAGRAASAHNLLLWQAMERLLAEGVGAIDLGTLDTWNAPGLARFKLGAGARPQRLGGTWLSL